MENTVKDSVKENREKMKSPLVDVSGRWKLTYKTRNKEGALAFGGRTIDEYENPTTGLKVRRKMANGTSEPFYFLSALKVIFLPDVKVQDRLDVEWLLTHPEIAIDGYDKLPDYYKKIKNTNSQMKLVCLDQQEMTKVEDEDFIDKLVGRLSAEGGPQAVGLERIRYIMAQLNLPYRDSRYMENKETEKKVLRSKLKSFVRANRGNAEKVYKILENESSAQTTFTFKEMLRVGIIIQENGMFKFQGLPLSVSYVGILENWENNPTLKADMYAALEEKLKQEGIS